MTLIVPVLRFALSLVVMTAAFPIVRTELRADDAPSGGLAAATEAFFAPAPFSHPELSPDGTRWCALTFSDPTHRALTLFDIATKRSRVLVNDPLWSVSNFWFKNDDLLLVMVRHDNGTRIFQSLDLTTNKMTLVDGFNGSAWDFTLVNILPDEADEMLFCSRTQVPLTSGEIFRINLRTGKAKVVERDPLGVAQWVTNRKGETIAAMGVMSGKVFNTFWREAKGKDWTPVFNAKEGMKDLRIWRAAPDGRRLLAQDFNGYPTGRMCYLDPATGELEEVVSSQSAEPEIYQFWGREQAIAALRYRGAESRVVFLNEEAKVADAWLAKALPGTERSFMSFSRDSKRAIVLASNDRNPGVYCIADFETQKVTRLAVSQPGIVPAKMARMHPFHFPSKDGLEISGSLWLPEAREKLPLVLLLGSAEGDQRAAANFDGAAQFFASRGFAVARIDFRGTLGFGRAFATAGDFQLGTGIVEDISAAIRLMSEGGRIDSQRIGIVGSGNGGVLAFQIASQVAGVRALVNGGALLPDEGFYNLHGLIAGGRADQYLSLPGGQKKADAYLAAINVRDAAKKISAASLNIYAADRKKAALKLKAVLDERNLPNEFVFESASTPPKNKNTPEWKQNAAWCERAADFLSKQL